MFTIRPFEPSQAEYEAVVAVNIAAWPDEPNTVENWQYGDQEHNPQYLRQRFVAENEAGQIVAEGICWESAWSHVPGKYGFGFSLHPAYANQGLEEQFYHYMLDFLAQREPKPVYLMTYMREDKTDKVQFLTERGFEAIMRDNVSQAEITDYDYSPFAGVIEKVLASGIELLTLPELQARDADWMEKFYDLETTIFKDVPSPDEFTPQPIEEFAKMFKHPAFLPEGQFIAVDEGHWVGLSTLWLNKAEPEKMHVGLTGVRRSHRRRRIATALKLLAFKYAQKRGIKALETENEENNPMYQLNVQLGFKPKPGWVTFRKDL